MVKKIKSCVFISGNGSNLNSIIKNSRDNNFPIKVDLVISNNISAKGLKYAKKYNIPFKFYSSHNQILFEKKCLLEGLDDIALSLEKTDKIISFEKNLKNTKPWIFND